MVIRKLVLAPGVFVDTDWMDPAVVPPDTARRFVATGGDLQFALRGRASSADNAAAVDLGAMTVDAYVLRELPDVGVTRGKSVAEVEGGPLAGEIALVSSDVPRGSFCRLHLDLAAVTAPVIEVVLLAGARML